MADNSLQSTDLYAPPSDEELGLFAPPDTREVELYAPPPQEQKYDLGIIPDEKFQEIGSKYGIDPRELKSIAPYYGARILPSGAGEAVEAGLKGTAGFIGSAALLNVPQYVYKKLQDEPMRRAIDEVQEVAREQQTPVEIAREFVVPGVGLPRALTTTAVGRIAGGAGLGAVAGAAGSREGEETRGAQIGAALGGGLGLGGEVLARAVSSRIRATPAEDQIIRNRQFDIEEGTRAVAEKTAKSEQIIDDITFGRRPELSRENVDDILNEQLGVDTVNRYLDPASDEGALIRRQLGETANDESIKNHLAHEIVDNRVRQFAEDITDQKPGNLEEAIEAIDQYASRQGVEATENRYRQFVSLRQAEKYITEEGIRATSQPNFFGRAINFISDNQFVLRHIDDQYGTRLEKTLADMNADYNRSTFALKEFRQRQDELFKKARSLGVDREITDTDKIYKALDTGSISNLSEKEQEVASGFRNYFDDIREFVNSKVKERDPRIAPLNIPHLKNYVPKMMKPIAEVIPLMEKKIDNTRDELSQLLGRDIRDIGQITPEEFKQVSRLPVVRDLIDAVRLADNRPIDNAGELSSRLKEMLYSRDGHVALETVARSAMERSQTRGIPDFLLEKDLYKLADRYNMNTMRHLYLRNTIDQMRYQARALAKAGADVESGYVRNLIGDIMGVRKGTAAEAFLQANVQASQYLDKLIDRVGGKQTVSGGALTAAKAIPDMLLAATRQIYPNLLGYFNIRAVIQNLTSGITKVAPELGSRYGYSTVLRGAVYTLTNLRRLINLSEQMGHVPAEFVREGEQAIADGIKRSSLFEIPARTLEGMGKAGMILYRWSENFNRALSTGIAEMMAHDISRGSKLALGSLNKFPQKLRKEILQNRNNPEITGQLLGKYLNDVTQYNYNRVSLSEFGRTMGPVFSAFSKWPTATVGDIIYEIRSKGLLKSLPRNAEKYILPLVLLQAVDYLLGENPEDTESLSDTKKKLLGSRGLSQSAPIGSISNIPTGEIFTPPAVDAVVNGIITPALEGNTGKLKAGASSIANNFLPGAGLIRFITDDIVTYVTGRRPEGRTFIERTESGARKLEGE